MAKNIIHYPCFTHFISCCSATGYRIIIL